MVHSRPSRITRRKHAECKLARRRLVLGFEKLEGRALMAVTPLGGEFRVNTFTTNSQTNPATAMDADGDTIVVWHSSGQDGTFPASMLNAIARRAYRKARNFVSTRRSPDRRLIPL